MTEQRCRLTLRYVLTAVTDAGAPLIRLPGAHHRLRLSDDQRGGHGGVWDEPGCRIYLTLRAQTSAPILFKVIPDGFDISFIQVCHSLTVRETGLGGTGLGGGGGWCQGWCDSCFHLDLVSQLKTYPIS